MNFNVLLRIESDFCFLISFSVSGSFITFVIWKRMCRISDFELSRVVTSVVVSRLSSILTFPLCFSFYHLLPRMALDLIGLGIIWGSLD